MNKILCCLAMCCLAFETKDEPPPTPTPPPVGHKIYKLSQEEITEMATLWLKAHNLPITGKVSIAGYSQEFLSVLSTTTSSSWSNGEKGLRIKVEYNR